MRKKWMCPINIRYWPKGLHANNPTPWRDRRDGISICYIQVVFEELFEMGNVAARYHSQFTTSHWISLCKTSNIGISKYKVLWPTCVCVGTTWTSTCGVCIHIHNLMYATMWNGNFWTPVSRFDSVQMYVHVTWPRGLLDLDRLVLNEF